MLGLIESRRQKIAELCRHYQVKRLDVFGSAAREDFRQGSSDIDLFVEFDLVASSSLFDLYFGLREKLSELLACPVDLVMASAVRNPNQLAKLDPKLAEKIPHLRRIVDFRNVLAHAYAVVDDALVWGTATGNKKSAGSDLDKEVLDAAIKQTREMGCFVAGTLVHTQQGLKPIEQIQVGDMVLSRHESGAGEQCYQPVTRTFQYEDRELYFVAWQVREPGTNRPTSVRGYMVVTGAHPIWVQRLVEYSRDAEECVGEINAWLSIEDIYLRRWKNHWEQWGAGCEPYVELADGQIATLSFIQPILQSEDPDIGVGFNDGENWEESPIGTKIIFEIEGPRISYSGRSGLPDIKSLVDIDLEAYDYSGYDTESKMSVVKRSGGYLPMRRRVFNLEVAHTHTYYVSEMGLWVHNTSSAIRDRPRVPPSCRRRLSFA